MVIRRAQATTEALSKAFVVPPENEEKKKTAAAFRQALMNWEVIGKLQTLTTEAEKLTSPFAPRIHIVRAWYGHLGKRWSEGSQCDATRAMREQCERKPKCGAPAGNPAPLDAVAMCGFDPASVARGLARGLAVEYSCETGDPDFWDKLTNNPLIHPDTGMAYGKDNSLRAVLRSSTMTINCEFPVVK